MPKTITDDNGSPYNSMKWKEYSKKCGFKSIPISPEEVQEDALEDPHKVEMNRSRKEKGEKVS